MKLFHMIQIVFKYELAASIGFSLNTSKDSLYENTVLLQYSIVTVPYDTNFLCVVTIHTQWEKCAIQSF